MDIRIRGLKFRYAGHGRADSAEIYRMMEDCPFDADRIDTNGPYAHVHFKESVRADLPELGKFVNLMDRYKYRLGMNDES